MQAVLERAHELADAGYVPVLADVTSVIRNGDIVARAQDGRILVTECKASESTGRSARSRRQAARARRLAEYLKTGIADDGLAETELMPNVPERPLVAVRSDDKETSYADLESAMEEATAEGSAFMDCGDGEFIFVGSDNAQIPEDVPITGPVKKNDVLLIGFSTDLVNDPSPLHPPVTLWNLPVDQRLKIWEKDLIVGHCVAESALVGVHPEDATVQIVGSDADSRLKVSAGDATMWLGPSFVESVLYEWEVPRSARSRGLELARLALAVDDYSLLADPGPDVRFNLFIPDAAESATDEAASRE